MILVTGATGHLGNVLVRQLLERGQRVRAMVLPNESLASLEGLDIECVIGNVLDLASLRRAMRGIDTVYHLAGIIAILPGAEKMMRDVNVQGVENTALAALDSKVARLVHVSSVHAFQRLKMGQPIDESAPLVTPRGLATYDETKAEGARVIKSAVSKGLDAVIVCPTGVIGPYDYQRSALGQTVLGFARQRLHVLVDGAYDFVDVRDAAKGMILAAERGRCGEMYILAGNQVRIAKLCDIVERVAGRHAPQYIVPMPLARRMARLAEAWYRLWHTTPQFTRYSLNVLHGNTQISGAKARRELGHQARPLVQTVSDTLGWLLKPQSSVIQPL